MKRMLIIVVAIGVGLIFVYFPRQNNTYQGPQANKNLCSGYETNAPNPGVKKNGLPIIDKTVYDGQCIPNNYALQKIPAAVDFTVGAVSGIVLYLGAFKLNNRNRL